MKTARRSARELCIWIVLLNLSAAQAALAAEPASGANSHPVYQELRRIGLGTSAVTVHELVLQRDAGTFTLHSGKLCFLAPVNGKVTGAVFSGDGNFSLVPPMEVEKRTLALLTKGQPKLEESFSGLVLRFTDNTYEEIAKSPAATSSSGGCDTGYLDEVRRDMRKLFHYNLEARILQDVISEQPGGFFNAFIKGKRYSNKMAYEIDPHGVDGDGIEPEEVDVTTYEGNKTGIWAAFHFSGEYANGSAKSTQQNAAIRIEHQDLNTQLGGGGRLDGKAATTIVSQVNGLRVVPFDLFRTLRVQAVTDAEGAPLAWIQEDKDEDPQYWVILPKALNSGEKFTIKTVYGGKDAVRDEGNGNYYPIARHNWYPGGRWSDYPTFEMVFATPKDMDIVATGALLQSNTEGNQTITRWRSEVRQPVAGFQYGRFKREEQKVPGMEKFTVYGYANKEEPSFISQARIHFARGDTYYERQNRDAHNPADEINTANFSKKAMAEGELSIEVYSDFFGPTGFNRLSMTQQTATYYGQSWPELVYLPITYFFDTTVRNALNMNLRDRGYFTVVGPHEVAHQWFGHTVGWSSYRDQWMSEGFSDFAASLFIQYIWKDPNKYQKFWRDEHELLTERNKEGFRAIDVGPLTLGHRLSNTRAGWDVYRHLVYPKGAYVLQMLRMMMQDPKGGDDAFKEMMRDFIKTYSNKAASTQDFQSIVEKHMTPAMDLTRNRKMDWFFNEWVEGTALPDYHLDYSFNNSVNGIVLTAKLTQSNVDNRFGMPVPIYIELANGKVARLGSINIVGNTTIPVQVPLGGVKETPKRVFLNHMADLLCTIDGK